MSTWDLFVGNSKITNWTRVSVKEAGLSKAETIYLKKLTEKDDLQQALDKYMKYTGWSAKKKLVDGKQTYVYAQTPVSKRIANIKKMSKLTECYAESMK